MIKCCECDLTFDGARADARRARWEPFSVRTQQAIDHGPMICPDCIRSALDSLLAAIRRDAQRPKSGGSD